MRYFYFSRLCVFLLSMITCIENFCQSLYPPKIQSPNAASLGTYGECPINLFNGMPDISVPVYTLSYGKINIPIWLRYNAAAVKPGQQPGWVGSGWDLECGGAITRQKHGKVDEWYVNNYAGSNPDAMSIKAYYPFPATSQQANSNFGSYYANLPYSWGSPSQLANDFFVNTYNDPYSGTLTSSPSLDPEADEFSFNALGHSGKFYYEGSSGWKVVSDEDIKVEVIDFFSPSEVVNGITEHVNSSGYQGCMYPSPSNAYQSRMFGSFRLTMPDGTKYIFGGRHGYNPPNGYCCPGDAPDAVEMSSPRGLAQDQNSLDLVFEINTWYLKTIIDPNGAQVSFSYINRYPTTTKFYQVDKSAGIAYNSGNNMSYSNGTDYDKYLLTENMQWPVYLNKILTPTEIMNFKMSNAVCNRYTQKQLTYANFSDNSSLNNATALEGVLLGSNCLFDPNVYLNNIQWQKLDSIVVTDNSYAVALYQNQPVITNKFAFTYSNSATQRLMLGSFQKLDKNSSSVEKYQFYYNSDLVTQSPNLHSDGNYTDHWGYYNGVDLPIDFPSVPMSKAPNPNVCTTELLNKIVYPTAGATVLTWESNDYSQIVSTDRQSLIPWSPGIFGDNTLTGVGGGNRIAEIKNVGSDGALLTDKKYYYKNGYTAGANISALTSSGVLNGGPVYSYSFNSLPGNNGVYYFSGSSRFFYSSGNYGYTGQGSPVGYKEIVEVNVDGSYTKYLFTNYDADINGVSHWDKPSQGSLGWNSQSGINFNYFPLATFEVERGKQIANFIYKPDNTLLQKTVYTFRNDAARFDSYINLIEKRNEFLAPAQYYSNGIVAVPSDRITFASARKVYTFSYYPVKKTTTTYDQNGNNPVVLTENFTGYNSSNLLTNKNFVNSAGKVIYTNYKYPMDFAGEPYASMTASHLLSPIIQTTATNNQTPISQTTENYSQPYAQVFVPQNLQIQIASNAPEIREQVNSFDSYGNSLEIQKPYGIKETYIWGVNHSRILARITGAGYNEAIGLVSQVLLNQAGFSYTTSSDEALRTELNKLRNGLSNALVTTYTFAVGVGLTSETDPNGRTTFYEYDAFNRLVLIRDQDKKILKQFCYNFAGQAENCNFNGNDPTSQSFTRTSCATDYIGTTGIYTVPANTYFSGIGKPDANSKAQDDVNQNGQNYVNSNSASGAACIPAVKATNTANMVYTITFTNSSNGIATSYTCSPSSGAVTLGGIAPATYNITFTPYGSTSAQIAVNGSSQTGSTITFSNVSVNTPVNITISPYSGGPCSFSMSPGYTSPTNSISSSGTTVSFYIVFYSSGVMTQGNSYQVATINGSCRPSAIRTINTTAGGRNWTITIYPDGRMSWQMAYGSAQLNANTTIGTSTLTYSL